MAPPESHAVLKKDFCYVIQLVRRFQCFETVMHVEKNENVKIVRFIFELNLIRSSSRRHLPIIGSTTI